MQHTAGHTAKLAAASSSGHAAARCVQHQAAKAGHHAPVTAVTARDGEHHARLLDRRVLLALSAAAAAAASAAPAGRPALAAAPASATRRPSSGGAGDWSSPGLAAPEDERQPRFFKTPSGARVQELSAGAGPAAQRGDAVLVDYVLRRANGYFIYSTVEGVSSQPRDLPVGPVRLQLGSGELIEGLEDALIGMQQGGKRRVLVPPELGYVSSVLQPQPPTFATKRQLANHSSEPLLFEIQLLRVLPGTAA